MCLHAKSICDVEFDCLNGDDEFGCDLTLCPAECDCLNYAVSCTNQHTIRFIEDLPYVKIYLEGVQDISISKSSCRLVQFLIITNVSLPNICSSILKEKPHVIEVEVSHSSLRKIVPGCFSEMPSLVLTNVSGNLISTIPCSSFDGNNFILSVDLSHNILKNLHSCMLAELKYLQVIYLQGNIFSHIALHAFIIHVNLQLIHTENFRICCAAKLQSSKINCDAKPTWSSSCRDLLSVHILKVVTWLLSLGITIFNLASISCCIWSIYQRKKLSYMVLVLGVNMIDMDYGIYLLVIAVADYHYSGKYFIHDTRWQSSILCHMMSVLSISSLMSSCLLLNLFTFLRLMVIKYPFESRFKGVRLPLQYLIGSITLCLSLAIVASVKSASSTVENMQPSPLCTPIVPPSFIINISLSVLQLTAVCGVTPMYSMLYKYASVSTPGSQAQIQKKRNNRMLQTLVLAGTSNALTWVPSSMIYLASLGMKRYPVRMLTWSVILLNSLNALSDPIILNIASLIHDSRNRSKLRDSFMNKPLQR